MASSRHIGFWKTGLSLRVDDGTVSARYNENSRSSYGPLLRAKLERDPEGTLLLGHIQWTVLLGGLLVLGVSAAGFGALGLGLILDGERFLGGWLAVLGLLLAALLAAGLRSEEDLRALEEQRLCRELLHRLGRRPS